MAVLRKAELEKIWNWLKNQLTPKELGWLATFRPIWKDFQYFAEPPAKTSWELNHASSALDLSFLIQDAVDAKYFPTDRQWAGQIRDRRKIDYSFGEGLPKAYLVEIAKILDVVSKDIDTYAVKMNKWELANLILAKIP